MNLMIQWSSAVEELGSFGLFFRFIVVYAVCPVSGLKTAFSSSQSTFQKCSKMKRNQSSYEDANITLSVKWRPIKTNRFFNLLIVNLLLPTPTRKSTTPKHRTTSSYSFGSLPCGISIRNTEPAPFAVERTMA